MPLRIGSMSRSRGSRALICLAAASLAVAAGGCGGGDDSTTADVAAADVGACVDAANEVVDCSSADATKRLVSDQSAPDAIACVEIGDKPQEQVTVGGTTFCAEDK